MPSGDSMSHDIARDDKFDGTPRRASPASPSPISLAPLRSTSKMTFAWKSAGLTYVGQPPAMFLPFFRSNC